MRKINQANEMREEYDFSAGVRGKYAGRVNAGDVTLAPSDGGEPWREVADAALELYWNTFAEAVQDVGAKADRSKWMPWLREEAERLARKRIGEEPAGDMAAHLFYEITCVPPFADDLRTRLAGVDVFRPRIRIFEEAWNAHREQMFCLTVPALVGLLEGALADLDQPRHSGSSAEAKWPRAATSLARIARSTEAVALGRAEIYASEAVSSELLAFLHGLATTLDSASKT